MLILGDRVGCLAFGTQVIIKIEVSFDWLLIMNIFERPKVRGPD